MIIGGGVAGLAAAVSLAEHRFSVQLFEKRQLLGGRASSFIDNETSERIDNCQHVTMRCCTNLEAFYRKIGVLDSIRYFDTIQFLAPDGSISILKGCRLPAPFHVLPSFLRFRALGWRDKIAIAKALIRILLTPRTSDMDRISMLEWLTQQRQTPRAISRFWRTILVSACNEELDQISALNGFKVFRDGFLINGTGYQMGLPTVKLADLYTEPSIRYLEDLGAAVKLRTNVEAIVLKEGRAAGIQLSDGSEIAADYVLSAIPFDLLLKLLPEEVIREHADLVMLAGLEYSPITGVHIWLDRKVEAPEAIAWLDREMQWAFNKTRTYREENSSAETYLGLVVSSARKLSEMSREEIISLALNDIRSAIPSARDAILVKARVIKEKKATFSPQPGSERLRPTQRSSLSGLYLAGDWTATGWPATMESAARSGFLAAGAILKDEGRTGDLLAPDLPPTGFCRLLLPKR